jgi:hypothetical protein
MDKLIGTNVHKLDVRAAFNLIHLRNKFGTCALDTSTYVASIKQLIQVIARS